MKRTFLAVGALGLCAAAHAQSNVAIYGIVDLSVGAAHIGPATTYQVLSGVGNSTRLGFRGTEDLGGGLKANVKLEMGIAADTGALTQGGAAFGRESWVGLSSNSWSINAGRQYSPVLYAMAVTDASNQAYWGSSQNAGIGLQESPGSGPGTGGHTAIGRVSNSVMGATNLGPVQLMGMLAFGDENTRKTGRLGSLGVIYRSGTITAAAGVARFKQYEQAITPTIKPEWQTTLTFGGAYDVGLLKLFAGYFSFDPADNRPPGTPTAVDPRFQKTASKWIGARLPFGASTLFLNGMRTRYKYAVGPDGIGTTLSFAYEYNLSKRTAVYVSYGQIMNSDTAIVPMLGAATAAFPTKRGEDVRVISLGLRNSF